MIVTKEQIEGMEQRRRAAFVNSLTGAKGLFLVGTRDSDNHFNLAPFSSIVHLGSSPPLLGMVSRPASVERHSYDNIKQEKYFSLNAITSHFYEKAHQCSARYPKHTSEFDEAGLEPEVIQGIPTVKESPLKILMKLIREVPIIENGTIFLISEVISVHAPDQAIFKDGGLDFSQIGSLTITGLDHYHELKSLMRLSYAKPGSKPTPIDK